MSISVACPHCSNKFSVPDAYQGKRGKCPRCGEAFTAEAIPAESQPVAPVPKSLAKSKNADSATNSPATAKPTLKPRETQSSSGQQGAVATANSDDAFDFLSQPASASSPSKSIASSRKKSGFPIALVAIPIVLVSIVGVGVAAYAMGAFSSEAAQANASDKDQDATDKPAKKDDPENEEDHRVIVPKEEQPPLSADAVAAIAEKAKLCVVQVKVAGSDETTTGVVVKNHAGNPIVLCSRTALLRAPGAVCLTANGKELEVLGRVGQDKKTNFVLLMLEPAGAFDFEVMPLPAGDGSQPTALVACRYGSEPAVGVKVEDKVSSSQLPPASKKFIRDLGMDELDVVNWYHHNASEDLPAGTPLVNQAGELCGIHFPLAKSARGGYAITSAHVAPLVASASETVTALGDDVASVPGSIDLPDPMTENPSPDPDPDPADNPEPEKDGELPFATRLPEDTPSKARIEAMLEVINKQNWFASNAEEYANLAAIAREISLAEIWLHKRKSIFGDNADEVQEAVDKVKSEIAWEKWPKPEQFRASNKLAIEKCNKSMGTDRNEGVLLYARYSNDTQLDGQPAMVFVVPVAPGTQAFFVLPVSKPISIEAGSRWLILGLLDTDRNVSNPEGAVGFIVNSMSLIEADARN